MSAELQVLAAAAAALAFFGVGYALGRVDGQQAERKRQNADDIPWE